MANPLPVQSDIHGRPSEIGGLVLSEILGVPGKLVLRHQRSQVLNGVIIFKISMSALFLVLAEGCCIQVGPIQDIQGRAAQALSFTEKQVVSLKSQGETGCGLRGLSRDIHCSTIWLDLFLFFCSTCPVSLAGRLGSETFPHSYNFKAMPTSKPLHGDVAMPIGSNEEPMGEIHELRPWTVCSYGSQRVIASCSSISNRS
jgi:hypothetical protein